MVTVRKLIVLLLLLGVTGGGIALADPNLGDIPRHRHFIKTPTGAFVEVGPRVCDDPSLQGAFNQFHNNIHVVSSTGIGPAAPGLHNLKGAEIWAGPCS
jgi:hypothetical protein